MMNSLLSLYKYGYEYGLNGNFVVYNRTNTFTNTAEILFFHL